MNRSRRGFTMIESCAAAAMLAATLAMVVSLLAAVARQRQAAALHARAVIAADNLLERITSEPYEAITVQRIDELQHAAAIAEMLPDATVKVKLAAEAGSPPGRRIDVDLAWRTTGAGPVSRHRVATWVYRAEAKQ